MANLAPAERTPAQALEQSPFATAVVEHIVAGYQMMMVPTAEENRAETELRQLVVPALNARDTDEPYQLITWDAVAGFECPADDKMFAGKNEHRDSLDPIKAIRMVADGKSKLLPKRAVFVFRDLDDFVAAPLLRRAIRSACEQNMFINKKISRPVVVLTPNIEIHKKLKTHITVLDFQLPNEAQLTNSFLYIQRAVAGRKPELAQCSPELQEDIVSAMLGLTSTEAENCLARCVVRHSGIKPEMLPMIKEEKATIIGKSSVLSYIDEDKIASRNEIGGFDNLLEFVDRRSLAYSKEAREHRIDYPKGIVLLGVPGTGKSVVAMAIGKRMNLPVYTMDVGAIFGSLVGESEARMRDAIRQITAQQGCVLLIDEADKAFGSAHNAQGDSGVTRRVFGQLLSWLAAKQDRTFVIMTMNRTDGIPPELLRAGRFDAVFYTELPKESEREQILKIHLRKRGVDPDSLGLEPEAWATLVDRTQDFVGSELEQLVCEARYMAFANRKVGVPNLEELLASQAQIVPLAKLDAEGVKAISDFVKNRARPVNAPAVTTTRSQPRRTRAIGINN